MSPLSPVDEHGRERRAVPELSGGDGGDVLVGRRPRAGRAARLSVPALRFIDRQRLQLALQPHRRITHRKRYGRTVGHPLTQRATPGGPAQGRNLLFLWEGPNVGLTGLMVVAISL